MKRILKPSSTILIGIILIFLNIRSFGQPRGMTMSQVNKQTGQWVANQQMQFMQQMMMSMRGVTATEQEFTFDVVMIDSTKKQVTSAIYTDSVTKKHFIVWIDNQYKKSDTNRYKKIFPSQTRSLNYIISAKDDDNPGRYIPAVITDSCWMFKTLTCLISIYTFDGLNGVYAMDQGAIVGVQLNSGPILLYTEDNLKAMVGDNLEAQQLILQKKYVRAIKKYNRDTEKQRPKDKPEAAD
jgi:hypothetical protein